MEYLTKSMYYENTYLTPYRGPDHNAISKLGTKIAKGMVGIPGEKVEEATHVQFLSK